MTRRVVVRGLLLSLGLSLGGCTLAREVEVCRSVARELAERFPSDAPRASDSPALVAASRNYRSLAKHLEESRGRAPLSLVPPLESLARESRQLADGFERATRARDATQLPNYRSAERTIDASGRRFKEAAKEFERACRSGR